MKKLVCRSLLFIPSHIEKMVKKIPSVEADCICLDLEDAVPLNMKEEGRKKIKQYLNNNSQTKDRIFVRVNPLESGWTLEDVDATASENLRGYIYPMCRSSEDIIAFSAQLSLIEMQKNIPEKHFEIIPLIETPESVERLFDIAGCDDRISGLLFGCEDYLAEIGAKHMDEDISLHYARSKIIGVAKACKILAIDTPYVKVKDDQGLEKFAKRASDMGMDGMLTLSPKQCQIANYIYSPSEQEVAHALAIINAKNEAEKMGRGVIIHDDKFISPPTIKASKRIIEKYDAINVWIEDS